MQSKSRLAQQKSVPSLKTVQEEGKENTDPGRRIEEEQQEIKTELPAEESRIPSSRRESTSSMIFSPLRDPDSPLSQVNGSLGQGRLRENLSTSSVIFSPVRDSDTSHDVTDRRRSEAGPARLFSDSVFSPLQDSDSAGSSLLGRRTPLSGLSTPAKSPLVLPAIREEHTGQSDSLGKERLGLDCLDSMVKETVTQGDKSPVLLQSPDLPTSPASSQQGSSVSSQTEDVARSNEIINVLNAFPEAAAGCGKTNTRPDIR